MASAASRSRPRAVFCFFEQLQVGVPFDWLFALPPWAAAWAGVGDGVSTATRPFSCARTGATYTYEDCGARRGLLSGGVRRDEDCGARRECFVLEARAESHPWVSGERGEAVWSCGRTMSAASEWAARAPALCRWEPCGGRPARRRQSFARRHPVPSHTHPAPSHTIQCRLSRDPSLRGAAGVRRVCGAEERQEGGVTSVDWLQRPLHLRSLLLLSSVAVSCCRFATYQPLPSATRIIAAPDLSSSPLQPLQKKVPGPPSPPPPSPPPA